MGRYISRSERERRAKELRDKRILRKAAALNKVMQGKNVTEIRRKENTYTVIFKNGQQFTFTFYPESLFLDDRIIPITD